MARIIIQNTKHIRHTPVTVSNTLETKVPGTEYIHWSPSGALTQQTMMFHMIHTHIYMNHCTYMRPSNSDEHSNNNKSD